MWDNLFRILIMNLGYIAILAVFILIAPLFLAVPALFAATILFGVALFAVYTGGVSKMCAEIADYRQPGFSDFFRFVRESLASSLLFALAIGIYGIVVWNAFRFYGGMKSIVGPLAVALLFWVTIARDTCRAVLLPHPVPAGQEVPKDHAEKLSRLFRQSRFFDRPVHLRPDCSCRFDVHCPSSARHRNHPLVVERRFQASSLQIRLARAEPRSKQAPRAVGCSAR